MKNSDFEQLEEFIWKYKRERDKSMEVDALVFASKSILDKAILDGAIYQVTNVASLPGILTHSIAMPDIHFGYGFCIGGVAAFDASEGITLPGGVGYDINCGVRLLATNIEERELTKNKEKLGNILLNTIPTGVGSKSSLKLSKKEFEKVLRGGAKEVVHNFVGEKTDLEFIESRGKLDFADLSTISSRAIARGKDQLGTLGAGNHFVEIEKVSEIYDQEAADAFKIKRGNLVVMIHTGSRGFGHQVATDYIERIRRKNINKIKIKDKQLIYAKNNSPEGKDYLQALNAASNFAWANRHMIQENIIEVFEKFFRASRREMGIKLVYDQAHNIAKFEKHIIKGKEQEVLVHRKGATRAFPAQHPSLPGDYKDIGQPVIIPGSMGTGSYLLKGSGRSMKLSFGSAPHGAGRELSRKKAIEKSQGRDIQKELKNNNILVFSYSQKGIREEMPDAYKGIDEVVDITHQTGLAVKVARMQPLLVIKG